MLLSNVLYLDGPNAGGKGYAIEKIKEGLLARDSELKIEVISIKQFYVGIDPALQAKIYSYKMECFTHDEVMYILSKHKEMLEYIDAWVASGSVDLVIVDRTVISTMVYNVLISKMMYAGSDIGVYEEYNATLVNDYIAQEIRPRLMAQKSLYVYLRFSLLTGTAYYDDALVKTITRLKTRGVEFTLSKVSAVTNIMEALHSRLHRQNENMPVFECSASSDLHGFFPLVLSTDSDHTDAIIDYLWEAE